MNLLVVCRNYLKINNMMAINRNLADKKIIYIKNFPVVLNS